VNKENGAGMNCGNIVEAPSRASVRYEFVRAPRRCMASRCDLSGTCRGKSERDAPPRIGAKISPQLGCGM
jgi:hypothetical protein